LIAATKQTPLTMERRYELLPQMREYDGMKINWTPYVMFTNQLNVRLKVCNTDDHGFRYTLHANKWLDYAAFGSLNGSKGIISGGSTAFGVGVSSDANTIPSLMNQQSDTVWFNFGGRASNSTQELMLFVFHLPKVDKVLLLSGVNNLVTLMQSAHYDMPFGGFMGDGRFYDLNMGGTERFYRLVQRRMRRLVRRPVSLPAQPSFAQRFGESLKIIERDLEVWRIFRDASGFSLIYFLQPFAGWTHKQLSDEELELFTILDHYQGPVWQTMFGQITDNYERYSEHLQAVCHAKSIEFVDLNKLIPREGWLFGDRVHLTDQGSMAVAALINSSL